MDVEYLAERMRLSRPNSETKDKVVSTTNLRLQQHSSNNDHGNPFGCGLGGHSAVAAQCFSGYNSLVVQGPSESKVFGLVRASVLTNRG